MVWMELLIFGKNNIDFDLTDFEQILMSQH